MTTEELIRQGFEAAFTGPHKKRFTCMRCGNHSSNWARGLESGRWVCHKCYAELPLLGGGRGVADDMRVGLNPRRHVKVNWEEVENVA